MNVRVSVFFLLLSSDTCIYIYSYSSISLPLSLSLTLFYISMLCKLCKLRPLFTSLPLRKQHSIDISLLKRALFLSLSLSSCLLYIYISVDLYMYLYTLYWLAACLPASSSSSSSSSIYNFYSSNTTTTILFNTTTITATVAVYCCWFVFLACLPACMSLPVACLAFFAFCRLLLFLALNI